MVNYQEGKIYKIVCNVTGLVYIGSTCEPILARRLAGHRKNYNKYLNDKYQFVTSFKVLENGDYSIILLEKCQCNDKMELLKRERHYIETNEFVNKLIPLRTNKEYREDNKEQSKLKYQENKEIIKERQLKYRENNREKLSKKAQEYHQNNKEKDAKRKKEWCEKNKEKLLEQNREYYKENKEILSLKASLKYKCECGSEIRLGEKARHFKTKKHQTFISNQLTV